MRHSVHLLGSHEGKRNTDLCVCEDQSCLVALLDLYLETFTLQGLASKRTAHTHTHAHAFADCMYALYCNILLCTHTHILKLLTGRIDVCLCVCLFMCVCLLHTYRTVRMFSSACRATTVMRDSALACCCSTSRVLRLHTATYPANTVMLLLLLLRLRAWKEGVCVLRAVKMLCWPGVLCALQDTNTVRIITQTRVYPLPDCTWRSSMHGVYY